MYLTSTAKSAPILDIELTLPHKQRLALDKLLDAPTDLFVQNPRAPKEATIATHVIKKKISLPHKDKFRRTPAKWKENVSGQLQEMEANGIIQPSESPYSSNILLTNKKDGSRSDSV